MDYSLDSFDFGVKYGQDHPEVTGKEARAEYEKYKDFYTTYYRNNPGATTDCYAEYLETLGKQGKQHTFIGRIEEQRGEEFEYCYWFCAILQEREGSWGVISWRQSCVVETLRGS